MPEQLLTILKFCLLAFIYLFFFRVLRAVWTEMLDPAGATAAAPRATRSRSPEPKPADQSRQKRRLAPRAPVAPTRLHVVGGTDEQSFPLSETLLVGRSDDCNITVNESFVSSFHAQIRTTPEGVIVDDLGSTNGTFVNRSKIDEPTLVRRGDVIGVGNVELELL